MKRLRSLIAFLLVVILAGVALATLRDRAWSVELRPNLEDRMPDGSPYNPSTQSFLRGSHWLDRVEQAKISVDRDGRGSIELIEPSEGGYLNVRNIPLDQIVPRLHYQPASPPDSFDALNLLLAEYSRNSLSVPVGKPSDDMAHFETDLEEAVPWTLAADYEFVPNPYARPIRFAVINNCLAPGLWELSAKDRTGEIYHSWFNMPIDQYFDLVAQTNGIDATFVEQALQWSDKSVQIRLDRLRTIDETIGRTSCSILTGAAVGYSSQDSRRKLHKHFVETEKSGEWVSPEQIDDLTSRPCRFSDFVEPGKYSITQQKGFDFRFLRNPHAAEVSRVTPHTRYDWRRHRSGNRVSESCLELTIHFAEHRMVIGNLPLSLLVPQEDFVLAGFGVGVLSSGGLAERRAYLIEDGPPPSFAYLCKVDGETILALNSHDFGIEQIFIRTHSDHATPWWEITITSYERVVDIVRIRVEIPITLHKELRQLALQYISPVYRTYRDDNIR